MKFRSRMALHAFGLRAIGLLIVVGQLFLAPSAFFVVPMPFGVILGGYVFFVAVKNAFALSTWWNNP